MRRQLRIWLVAAALVSAPGRADAGLSGGDLWLLCTDGDVSPASESLCLAYLDAAIDAHAVLTHVAPEKALFCPPAKGVMPKVASALLRAWIDHDGERRKARAVLAAYGALANAYPCKQ